MSWRNEMYQTLLLLFVVTGCGTEQVKPQQIEKSIAVKTQPQTKTTLPSKQTTEANEAKPNSSLTQKTTKKQETKPGNPVLGEMPIKGKDLITVNNQKITEGVIDALLSNLPEDRRAEIKKTQLEKIKEQLVTTELLYQAAIEDNLIAQEDVQTAMLMAQRQVLATTVLQVRAEAKLTNAKLQQAYNDQLSRFQSTEADLAMIIVQEETLAKDLHKQITDGADFATLAKEHGLNPQAKTNGGDMGKMSTQKLPPQVKKSVETAKENTLLAPQQMGRSWGIIKVKSVETKFTPFEDVKEELKAGLVRQYSQEVIDELKNSATIIDHTPPPAKPTISTTPIMPTKKQITPPVKITPNGKTK